jgi:hypothetical protein
MLEVNLLKNLNHPNIVSYKESFLVPEMLIIIMEFCEGKSGYSSHASQSVTWRSTSKRLSSRKTSSQRRRSSTG